MKFNQTTKDFLQFVRRAPTAFQAVDEIASLLKKDGFQKISLQQKCQTKICGGGKYFMTCNQSSLIAFSVPEN